MYREITIGDKSVPMLSLASVDVYYKRVFRVDPLSIMTGETDNGQKTGIAFGMGFIMAKMAELKDRKKMQALSHDDYLDWIEQFEYGDYVAAAADIIALYYGQKSPSVQEKNAEGQ